MIEKMVNPHGGDAGAVASALGLGAPPEIRLDFSVNVNPLGPPANVRAVLSCHLSSIFRYPEAAAGHAASCLAKAHGVGENSVIVGNGSTEIFSWIIRALNPQSVGWIDPCYTGYDEVCRASGIKGRAIAVTSPEQAFAVTQDHLADPIPDMLFLTTPNNPTGIAADPNMLLDFASAHSGCRLVVDESFMDFMPDAHLMSLVRNDLPPNLIVVKSLTKFFCIPGLRLGMAYAHPDTIERIGSARLPWSVNALAQSAATVLYADSDYLRESRDVVTSLRGEFTAALSELNGFTVYPSEVNFLLVKLPPDQPAPILQGELLQHGILIRSCHNFPGLGEGFCRLAVRPREEMETFMAVLRSVVKEPAQSRAESNSAYRESVPAIMVVGTMSHSGKSVVAAGLCRYFARRGLNVAPFKAQNMALNSFVTADGGEMGRAQVVQADAAGVTPHTDMNPVLLKPTGETGSQVIVNGRAIGNFTAREYYEIKDRMRTAAHEAYDRLSTRHDLIILEGAGSPAEINLQAEDFVNMDMAAYAGADAILVADIDRGGVFASIFGTINLLLPEHRRLIKGIIINKFRGDISLLDSGIREIEASTGIPVLGVLPYITDLQIEDEDSLGLENRMAKEDAVIDIVVIQLPRISNFTDFIAFEKTDGVRIRYVSKSGGLGTPDLIIIPGTKNTRSDLRSLRESGLADKIVSAANDGIPLFGICGGYQMLGTRVSDPTGVEGPAGEDAGLNLLAVTTVLEPRKKLAQVSGVSTTSLPFAEPETQFEGYEIHAGRTVTGESNSAPLILLKRQGKRVREPAGAVSPDGLIFGSYIHGLFDRVSIRKQLLNWLCKRKGVPELEISEEENAYLDEFDRLADLIEKHIDLGIVSGTGNLTPRPITSAISALPTGKS